MTVSSANQSAQISRAIQTAQEAPPLFKQEAIEMAVSIETFKMANETGAAALSLLLSTVQGLGANIDIRA